MRVIALVSATSMMLTLGAPAVGQDAQPIGDLDCPGPGCPSVPFMLASDVRDGDRLAQLGAFDTAFEAGMQAQNLLELEALREQVGEGLGFIVQEASSGGRTFFRLRIGLFPDLTASRRFCAELVSMELACIPVTQRGTVPEVNPSPEPTNSPDQPVTQPVS